MIAKNAKALLRRRKQSAIVSQLVLEIAAAMRLLNKRGRGLHTIFLEMMIVATIRVNDEAGGAPMTITAIAKNLNVPRTNVIRAADAILQIGMLKKEAGALVSNPAYIAARIDATYFVNMVTSILKAADDLRATMTAD